MSGDRRVPGDRGVSAVIGVVLLVGLVAIGSIGILVFAGSVTEDTKRTAEQQRVEAAFLELQADTNSVAQSEDDVRRTNLDLPDDTDGAVRKEDAGEIVIQRKNLTTTQTVVVKDIGAIVYEDENVHYAYQAGAVWRGTGNETEQVGAPNIVYDTSTRGGDPTFILPLVDLAGNRRVSSGEVVVAKNATRAPLNDVGRIDNQLVVVNITSDYYVGWGTYFEERYDRVVVSYDHGNDTATIKLGRRDIGGDWEDGIQANGEVDLDDTSGTVAGSVVSGGTVQGTPGTCDAGTGSACVEENSPAPSTLAPLDEILARKTIDAKGDCGVDVNCTYDSTEDAIGPGQEFGGGQTYYFSDDSLLTGDTAVVDLSEGNVTMIFDGELGLAQSGRLKSVGGDLNASPNCCYLRLYFNGTDLAMGQKGTILNDNDNATRNQIYGTSEFHLDGGQMQAGGGFDAGVYAPGTASSATNDATSLHGALNAAGCAGGGGGTDYDVCFGKGSGTLDAAIVAGSVGFDQNAGFDYDQDLAKVSPTLGYDGVVPPPLTFLHVSVNRVCVGNTTCG